MLSTLTAWRGRGEWALVPSRYARDMSTLVLLRHGQSEWNAKNLFTGWVDVGLTEVGTSEAVRGGQLLQDADALPDVLHTSVQRRAIRTSELALEACDRQWIPVRRSWRLNERHYGALQGKDKKQTLAEFGEEQFMLWRRSYDTPPPPLPDDDEFSQVGDARYAGLPPELLPRSECLKDVLERMLPYWYDAIVPDLQAGLTVLVTAHGNSLRALVKHLDEHLRRRDRRAQHPHRHPAALRPRRRAASDDARADSTSTPTAAEGRHHRGGQPGPLAPGPAECTSG